MGVTLARAETVEQAVQKAIRVSKAVTVEL
ncbi:MAG: hypothetical protein AB1Y36_11495 [Cycloclasticus sp.]